MEEFAEWGILLDNPARGCPMVLNVDGDQVPLSLSEVSRWIGFAISPLNVQWWVSETADVICWFDYEPLVWEKQTYYLDGLSSDEIRRVESAILGQVEAHPGETIAVVIDVHGTTVDTDWDRFVRDPAAKIELMPDALVLAKVDTRGGDIVAAQSRRDLGDRYRIFSSQRWHML